MTPPTARTQGMNWCRQTTRLAIYLRDGMACAYCGDAVESGAKLTLDHIKPHSNGGSNDPANLVTCCHRCNSSRGTRPVTVFASAVAEYLNHGAKAADIVAHVRRIRRRALPSRRGKATHRPPGQRGSGAGGTGMTLHRRGHDTGRGTHWADPAVVDKYVDDGFLTAAQPLHVEIADSATVVEWDADEVLASMLGTVRSVRGDDVGLDDVRDWLTEDWTADVVSGCADAIADALPGAMWVRVPSEHDDTGNAYVAL